MDVNQEAQSASADMRRDKPESARRPFACADCGDTFDDGITAGHHEIDTGHRVYPNSPS